MNAKSPTRIAIPSPKRRGFAAPPGATCRAREARVHRVVPAPHLGAVHHVVVRERERVHELERGRGVDDARIGGRRRPRRRTRSNRTRAAVACRRWRRSRAAPRSVRRAGRRPRATASSSAASRSSIRRSTRVANGTERRGEHRLLRPGRGHPRTVVAAGRRDPNACRLRCGRARVPVGDMAARARPRGARRAAGLSALAPIVIEQVVRRRARPGRGPLPLPRRRRRRDAWPAGRTADAPDVRLTTDYDTAVAIARGRENAQIALAQRPAPARRRHRHARAAAPTRWARSTTPPPRSAAARPRTRRRRIRGPCGARSHPQNACARSPAATSTTTASRPQPPTRSPDSRTNRRRSSSRAGACSRTTARTARCGGCARRILAARRRRAAAHVAVRELEADRTGDRLGATLPLLDEGEVVAVVGYTSTIDDALLERFDIDAVAVRVDGDDPVAALRRRRSDHAVRVVDEWDPVLEHAARLLVSATAIGPDAALVPSGTGRRARDDRRGVRELWLVGGVGRVLPARCVRDDRLVAARRRPRSRRSRSSASTASPGRAASNARPTPRPASTAPWSPNCSARSN